MSSNPIQRRRRVLRDETKEVRKSERPATKAGRKYTEGALEDSQPRITDFVPRSGWRFAIVFAAGLLTISSLALVYVWRATAATAGGSIASALDLAQGGSIASWFAATMALGCAAVAMIIYNIRRHRIADYRGRYRMWTWTAFVFVLASVDAIAQVSHLVASVVLHVTNGFLIQTVPTWVFVGWSFIALTVAIPLLLDLRMNQSTMIGLLSAGICYAGAGLLYTGRFQGWSDISHMTMQVGLLHLAHLFMVTSLLAFARLVFLDAQGRLDRKRRVAKEITPPEWAVRWRQRQAVKRAERKAQREDSVEKKTEGKRTKKRKVVAKASPKVVQVEYDTDDQMDPQILQNPDLTKAERRKLKKQLRHQSRRAA